LFWLLRAVVKMSFGGGSTIVIVSLIVRLLC
jgi:hypothetical protein